MLSQLPPPDTTAKFSHPTFNKLLQTFENEIYTWKKQSSKLSLVVEVSAQTAGSDIDGNDFSGRIVGNIVHDSDKSAVFPLFSCQLVRFTGNCGVKAIDHLSFSVVPSGVLHADEYKEFLKILESFAFHKTNCGYLIGSDTNCKGYVGRTMSAIKSYGTGYVITDPTWNPNYTWSKDHQISLFWKNLNGCEHENYWE